MDKKVLIMFITFSVIVRLSGLSQIIFGDELFYAETVKDQEYVNYYGSHPPLSFWAQAVLGAVAGISVWKMRLFVGIISVVNIVLTYFLARKHFNEKVANWSVALLSLSAWFTSGSLQLDMDASFVSLFFILSAWFYTKWIECKHAKYLWFLGVSYGLGISTKYTSILIMPILAVHYFAVYKPFDKKSFAEFLRAFIIFSFIGILLFFLISAVLIAAESNSFTASFKHSINLLGSRNAEGINYALLLVQFLNALIWISPLFAGLFICFLFLSENKKNLFFIWIIAILFFYLFIIRDNFRPIEKYLLIIASPLSIIGGEIISKIIVKKRQILLLCAVALLWFSFLLIFNSQRGEFIDFYPKTEFLKEMTNLNMLLNIPLEGHAGPIGFYILSGTILLTFIVSGTAMASSLLLKNTKFFPLLFIIFLGVSIGYNIYLMEEYALGKIKPNINKVSRDVVDYLLKYDTDKQIFVFRNFGMEFYLENKFGNKSGALGEVCTTYTNFFYNETTPCIDKVKTFYLDFKDENSISMSKEIGNRKPVVAIVDFPQISKRSVLWQTLQNCSLAKTFEDKNFKIGYVFKC